MKAKEAAETQPTSRKSREPKLKERKREKKRRRKVRRKQKVSIDLFFFFFSFLNFHLTLLMSFGNMRRFFVLPMSLRFRSHHPI